MIDPNTNPISASVAGEKLKSNIINFGFASVMGSVPWRSQLAQLHQYTKLYDRAEK